MNILQKSKLSKKQAQKTIYTITREFQKWTLVRLQTQMYGNIETLRFKFEDVYSVSLCLCPNSLNEIVLMSWLSSISVNKTLGNSYDFWGNIGNQ